MSQIIRSRCLYYFVVFFCTYNLFFVKNSFCFSADNSQVRLKHNIKNVEDNAVDIIPFDFMSSSENMIKTVGSINVHKKFVNTSKKSHIKSELKTLNINEITEESTDLDLDAIIEDIQENQQQRIFEDDLTLNVDKTNNNVAILLDDDHVKPDQSSLTEQDDKTQSELMDTLNNIDHASLNEFDVNKFEEKFVDNNGYVDDNTMPGYPLTHVDSDQNTPMPTSDDFKQTTVDLYEEGLDLDHILTTPNQTTVDIPSTDLELDIIDNKNRELIPGEEIASINNETLGSENFELPQSNIDNFIDDFVKEKDDGFSESLPLNSINPVDSVFDYTPKIESTNVINTDHDINIIKNNNDLAQKAQDNLDEQNTKNNDIVIQKDNLKDSAHINMPNIDEQFDWFRELEDTKNTNTISENIQTIPDILVDKQRIIEDIDVVTDSNTVKTDVIPTEEKIQQDKLNPKKDELIIDVEKNININKDKVSVKNTDNYTDVKSEINKTIKLRDTTVKNIDNVKQSDKEVLPEITNDESTAEENIIKIINKPEKLVNIDADKKNYVHNWNKKIKKQDRSQSKILSINDLNKFTQGNHLFVMDNYKDYLFFAVARGDIGAINALLDKIQNIEMVDKNNNTPLLFAVKNGYVKSIRCLLVRGADPYAKDKNNYDSFQIAREKNRADILEILNESIK